MGRPVDTTGHAAPAETADAATGSGAAGPDAPAATAPVPPRSWRDKPLDVGIPGPTPADMGRAFWSVRADPLSFLGRVRDAYGDTVAFPVPGPPAVLVDDPADVRRVLQTHARHWDKQTVQYAALARVTGPGLLASAEPSWITHRRMAAPAFHHTRLERVGDQVRAAADAVVDGGALDVTRDGWGGDVVDVAPLVMEIALDAVGRALFSTDLTGRAQELLDASSSSAEFVVRAGRAVLPLPDWLPTPTEVRLRSARRRMDVISRELIAQRRAEGLRDPSVPGVAPGHGDDLLGLLVDSGLCDEEIRDELVTMVIAGHETVAGALAWTLMLLAEHQPAQDRLRAELAALDGPVPMLGQRERLPWTRAVIDEALRLFPPAWAISRRSTREDQLGGRTVPAGTIAIISPWLHHRREDLWPEPLAFRPERFLHEAPARVGYLPFGQGPRLCIGREFALGEMAIVLGRLLADHRVEVTRGWTRPAAKAQVAVHPRGGMPLRVTPLGRGR